MAPVKFYMLKCGTRVVHDVIITRLGGRQYHWCNTCQDHCEVTKAKAPGHGQQPVF